MTNKEIIDGLKFTIDMFLFDPTTGETLTGPRNDMDKTTIEACRGAIKALEKAPCEDLMAIHTQGLDEGIRCAMCTNSMKSDRGCDGGCVVDNVMYKKVIETIANHIVPLVTPTQKWIPVSERLPEEWESVLVCFKSQGGIAQCVSERLVNMDGSNRWSALCGQKPIAWMPLPEAYKGGAE